MGPAVCIIVSCVKYMFVLYYKGIQNSLSNAWKKTSVPKNTSA